MCARSQQRGDMSGEGCRAWSVTGTGSSTARLRARDACSASTISDLSTTSGDGRTRGAPVEVVVGRAPAAHHVAVLVRAGRLHEVGVHAHPVEGAQRGAEAG